MQQPPPLQGVEPGQQAWPGAPHTAQAPAEQAPPLAQVEPEATQVLLLASQQPPEPQVLLAQHG